MEKSPLAAAQKVRSDKPTPTQTSDTDGGVPITLFHTHVKLFITHTGDDNGETCEIQSSIYFSPEVHTEGRVELPLNHDFSNENGGLGRLLQELDEVSLGAPARFHAVMYEVGGVFDSDRYIVERVMDWGHEDPAHRNGSLWKEPWFGGERYQYQAKLQWQTTPGSV